MRTGKMFPAALLSIVAALAFQAPASARQQEPNASAEASSTAARERDTNRSLLEALIARRDEIARLPVDPARVDSRRYALDFLDKQIAKVRKRIGD